MEENKPRFKTWMAGKDYQYIAMSLKAKRLPSSLSETMSLMYMVASVNNYRDKDYPLAAKYFMELARKSYSY